MLEKYLKKRIWLFGITLLIVALCLLTSYNVKNKKDLSTTDKVINSGNLEIILVDGKNGFKNSVYPLSYEQGNLKSPSNIVKIVNKSNLSTKFYIYINQTNVDNNSIDLNKIYYSINNENPRILGSSSSGEILSGTIKGRREKIFDIKVWAGEEFVDSNDAGKTLSFEINVK